MLVVAISLAIAATTQSTPVPPVPPPYDSCICDPAVDVGCNWPDLSIVSRNAAGQQAPSRHALAGSISADGNWVAFRSESRFFAGTSVHVPNQIYLKNLQTGALIHASPSIWGGPSENQSFNPVVSHDGRRVAFVSFATDLVSATDGLSSISRNVFVFDRITGQVEVVSASPTGDAGNHAADL